MIFDSHTLGRAHAHAHAQGECPAELDPGRPGAPVTVNLMRKEEPYSEPERPKQ